MVLSALVVVALLQIPNVDEKEPFQSLETRVSGAIQIKNMAALEELVAKDFTFSAFLAGQAPIVMNRAEWLKTSEHYTLTGFELRNVAGRVFGNVAVVRLQPNRTASAGGALDRSGEFAVVDVWTKDGDNWKLSSRYLSRPDTLKR